MGCEHLGIRGFRADGGRGFCGFQVRVQGFGWEFRVRGRGSGVLHGAEVTKSWALALKEGLKRGGFEVWSLRCNRDVFAFGLGSPSFCVVFVTGCCARNTLRSEVLPSWAVQS